VTAANVISTTVQPEAPKPEGEHARDAGRMERGVEQVERHADSLPGGAAPSLGAGAKPPKSIGAIGTTYQLFLREYTTRARIGIYPQERLRPQPLVVSVNLELVRPGRISGMADLFDYSQIAVCIEAVCARTHHDLQEELCMAIIEALLKVAPARLIEVTTQKPRACPKAKAIGCTMRWQAHREE
jgi:7,8-dihydroneopterin aldolase/epimerase/oxygenase